MIRPAAAALLLAALLAYSTACGGPETPANAAPGTGVDSARGSAPPYDFASPDARFALPRELTEISALTLRPDGRLAAVQDEQGIIFTIDPTNGTVVGRRRFAGLGDFEGIEWADGATWILRSDGTLFAVPDSGGAVEEFDTPLDEDCDAEGLGFDAIGRVLVIQCKEDIPGEQFAGARGAFAFSLDSRRLSTGPVLLLPRGAVGADDNFKPAALAVHPTSRQVYVISSVRKAIAVLDARGTLESVTPLSPALYSQPEGLAFAPDGTLFISNEGAGGAATLLRFAPRANP